MKNKDKRARTLTAVVLAAVLMAAPAFSAFAAGTVVVGGGSGMSSSSFGPGAGSSIDAGGAGVDITGWEYYQPNIPGRVDYFDQAISDPIVQVVEKYSYDQMASDLNALQRRYGDRIHVNVIGTSLDGRNIYEAILGNTDAPHHVLIQGGSHAREYMTPLLMMKQLEYGLAFYDSVSFDGIPLTELLSQVAVHFVPMVNPDGISISQGGEGTIRSQSLRNTMRDCYNYDVSAGRTGLPYETYLIYWKANARGVDINQNFPADWDQVTGATQPSYATYRGDSALSEPESQALANLANSRSWDLSVSYHSMGNLIYWDYPGNRVHDKSYDFAQYAVANTGYTIAGSSGHGGFKDWTQIKDNPIPGVTIEVGSVDCPMPLSQWPEVWSRNKMIWALAAEYAYRH